MHIIPAIDIIDGKCVRLAQGQYAAKTVYDESPVDVAMRFQDAGIKRLHVVDLDGAKAKRIVNYRTLEQITRKAELLHLDFGGGIQSDDDVRIAFESGARQITAGSIAVKNQDMFLRWLRERGAEAIILAADARDERIAVSGWEEVTEISLMEFLAEYESQGIKYVMCTDISKDGMMQGSANDLYRRIRDERPLLNLIASGGVSSLHDLEELESIGVWGAIIGKALYEGTLTIDDLKRFF
ncbi:MAG: 1-(5-phosphoribosyl)-5-[(5-phosphoribosylamino)methylideneamino]imidazole-4-carboxamide isomerase [Ignavibacteria bacterium]|nr:1-(5-phosphoribosyl)-5-[(5-phosphoribosylamino)methylideneamino]imidazole-4-carboxamide isomerase [Ignavibacteria bacterium]MBL7993721.1 1-(5-phosphoribosyl)-5-[(5-phosphoribosylamino)methylideneamino]imidazole-4-carboxamide isomerase [Candidatus Kapabacteria bacterium]